MCGCSVCCVNEWATKEYNDYVDTLLASMLIWDRYGGDIGLMSIDDRVNSYVGCGVCVGKNE